MLKDIALFIASARLWTTPQVDKEYECARVAIALAFEIEGWGEMREVFGKMHGNCAGLFEKALGESFSEDTSIVVALGNEWGTSIDLSARGLDERIFYGDPQDAVKMFMKRAKFWMEPFYGKPVWEASESGFFMQESQAIHVPLTYMGDAIKIRHGGGTPMPKDFSGFLARIEAQILARGLDLPVDELSVGRKPLSL